MKSIGDRRLITMKHHLRKAEKNVKFRAVKIKDRERASFPALASPPSKAAIPHVLSNECVHKMISRIKELLDASAFESDELFNLVVSLKTKFSSANKGDEGDVETFYQTITSDEYSVLARLMGTGVPQGTQSKTMTVFVEVTYGQFARLLVQSQDAMKAIFMALNSTSNAVRLRAVWCIANLAEDEKVRDYLLLIPDFVAGLIQNLNFDYQNKENHACIIIVRDACWAVNNIFSGDTKYASMLPFLKPLVNALVFTEICTSCDMEQVHALIRFALRALEKAMVTASFENLDCSLQSNTQLIHYLSRCMRFRREAETQDIAISALSCMRHYSVAQFEKELFITDIARMLLDEKHRGADATVFLQNWCSTMAYMMANGISEQMEKHIVTRITTGLFSMTKPGYKCEGGDLLCIACHALTVLGCSLKNPDHIKSFWTSGGGYGLLRSLLLNADTDLDLRALSALNNIFPDDFADASSYLLAAPKLLDDLKDIVDTHMDSKKPDTRDVAAVVMKKLDGLEISENDVERPLEDKNVKVPANKRRRFNLGEFNA